jgi:hypothetical protein
MAHPALDTVAHLIRTQHRRIEVSPGIAYTVTAPCLLAQLRDSIGVGMERGGGQSVPGSRPPVSTDALDLWTEILYAVHTWADHLGIDRRDKQPESPTPHVGRLLRTVAATASSTGRELMTNKVIDKAVDWRERITRMLAGTVAQRGIRGAACDVCGQQTVEEQREDGRYRVPAIVVATRPEGTWIVCQYCGDTRSITDDAEPEDDGAGLEYRTETPG